MQLTKELIEALKTDKGGFTGATLRAIGLKPYPPKGWTYRLRGKVITEEQYQKALEGRHILKGKEKRPESDLFSHIPCAKCGNEQRYSTTEWCEPCLWELIKDDQ